MYQRGEARCDALAQLNTYASRQRLTEGVLQAILTTHLCLILLVEVGSHLAQCASCNLAVGIYSLIDWLTTICQAHIPVQDRVLLQLLPLVEVHRAGQYMHRVVVADGVVDGYLLQLGICQCVPQPLKQSLTHRQRVPHLLNSDAVVAGIHQAGVVISGGAVLEENVEQLCQRVGITLEELQRVEALATHIEVYAVTLYGCRQRLTIACQNRATQWVYGVTHEDTLIELLCICRNLGAKEEHPQQSHNHD